MGEVIVKRIEDGLYLRIMDNGIWWEKHQKNATRWDTADEADHEIYYRGLQNIVTVGLVKQ